MRNLQSPGRSPVSAPYGMAATSHNLSTQAAIAILQQGGNAMDAAVAAVAVQCVVEPGSTGIGGDCFALYAPAGGDDIIAFNGSGRAPQGVSSAYLLDRGITEIERNSPHAVTIPGAVDGWVQLNRDQGSMPLSTILAAAIDYAGNGYPVGQRVAFDASRNVHILDEDGAAVFAPDGKAFEMGDRHCQPALARTLEKIAHEGRDGFYKGSVAEDIITKLQSVGGTHVQADFDNAIGDYVTPIKTNFRGYDVWECPPNGQGMIALHLLNVMGGVDLPNADDNDPLSIARMHHEIEACRLAYRDRGLYLGDPAFSEIPVEAFLSGEYADRARANIDPNRAQEPLPPSNLPRHKSTVYISVVDKDRNAVSFINTLFYGFGTGIMAPKSGVLLQNRGMGFVVDDAHPNGIAPGKRPLHTIIPGMVTKDGRAVMPFGVMGGDYQAFGHMQLLSRMFDYGMDIQQAQDMPRYFPDPFSDEIEVEDPIPNATRKALRAMGHNIVPARGPIGGSQAIWIDWDNDMLMGGSDPRKDGCAIGY